MIRDKIEICLLFLISLSVVMSSILASNGWRVRTVPGKPNLTFEPGLKLIKISKAPNCKLTISLKLTQVFQYKLTHPLTGGSGG